MGNAPLKRAKSTMAPSSSMGQVRRSKSIAVASSEGKDKSSIDSSIRSQTQHHRASIAPGSQPTAANSAMKRRSSKGFHSSVNISTSAGGGGGHSDSTGGGQQLLHPAPEKYLMTPAQRDLIRYNWDGSRDRRFDIARRIYGRAFNKRPDMREIYEHIGGEIWAEEALRFADFLDRVIQQVDDLSAIERLALEMGRRHGEWRQQGFKPEFWVALAESMTKECCYLDLAVHPAGEVLASWSKLIGLIFGWARDGYYEQVRAQRRMSRKIVVTKSASTSSRSLSGSSRSNSTDEQQMTNSSTTSSTILSTANGGTTGISISTNGNGHLPSIEAVGTPPSDSVTLT